MYGLLKYIMISLYKNVCIVFQGLGGLSFLIVLPLPTVLLVACPYGRVFLCYFIKLSSHKMASPCSVSSTMMYVRHLSMMS